MGFHASGRNGKTRCDTRDDAIINTVGAWTRNSPADVTNWLAQLPEGAIRDKMVNRIAWDVSETDPEVATEWAGAIGDETRRREGVNDMIYK
jgi:hypothetical protein